MQQGGVGDRFYLLESVRSFCRLVSVFVFTFSLRSILMLSWYWIQGEVRVTQSLSLRSHEVQTLSLRRSDKKLIVKPVFLRLVVVL